MSHVTVFDIFTGVLTLWEIAHSKLLSINNCLCVIKYSKYFMSDADFTIDFQLVLIQPL